ncbi:ferritin-like domain-containing protein [Lampropedia puyangensis]|uniref:Ferritin-like domain-containing protein n=1 Tax=Lampropedia puyangensis TaxID=1330072 RepID=A0A4S8F1B9_9BURK|nr:ferritin-like domain-containing protein [Lampropedia puyangensis]THU01058.1 ferritin-like domain-containing protein [Lampropedia puyangensis]
MNKAALSPKTIDIEALGFDAGAHLLVKHALAALPQGQSLRVTSRAPGWQSQLAAWARAQGHPLQWESGQQAALMQRGNAEAGRWHNAAYTGHADAQAVDAVLEHALPGWGLAARGARVEAGGPQFHFKLDHKQDFWAENAADLYTQAVHAQWNPDTALDWNEVLNHPPEIEAAIVQVMTYMIENENAALLVPARFLGQLHPHYRELQAALAIQVADEARHIEVFTRRVRLGGAEPALSTAGGQASLKSLLDEPDFSIAGFLLSVLGEGTFVNLLQYLQAYAPDALTRQMCRLAARDEARHVALGMSHLLYRLQSEPSLRSRLANAVQARHDQLAGSSGLNEEVFDALILIGAGSLEPAAVQTGFERVQQLMRDMGDGRFTRLLRLGFEREEAERLSSLHTRNFM